MSGRCVRYQEEVRLRRPAPVTEGMKFKVTARYEVQVSARKKMRCVRISSLNGIILHYSEKEYLRLFKPV